MPFKAARSPNGPALDAIPHTFGFVCGVHFSGTSILHYALGRNPEVSIMRVAPKRMDEGQGFQDVMPTGAACALQPTWHDADACCSGAQLRRWAARLFNWCAPRNVLAPQAVRRGADAPRDALRSLAWMQRRQRSLAATSRWIRCALGSLTWLHSWCHDA